MTEQEELEIDLKRYLHSGMADWCELTAIALRAQGWRKVSPSELIVPREPSEEMLMAAGDVMGCGDPQCPCGGTSDIYHTMLIAHESSQTEK